MDHYDISHLDIRGYDANAIHHSASRAREMPAAESPPRHPESMRSRSGRTMSRDPVAPTAGIPRRSSE